MDQFVTHRPLLFGLAYRMIAGAGEAEDIMQDTFISFATTPRSEIIDVETYLISTVLRLSRDYAQAARVRRQEYLGPWLPEPVLTPDDTLGPLATTTQRESISLPILTLLDSLDPLERAVYLLNEVFAYPDTVVAEVAEHSPAYCRQLAHRAAVHLDEQRPRFDLNAPSARSLTERCLQVCQQDDLPALMSLFAPEVTAWSDGGSKASTARKPVAGPDAVARFLLGLARKSPLGLSATYAEINCGPALLVRTEQTLQYVLAFDVAGDHIQAVRVLMNPDKLAFLRHQLRSLSSPSLLS